MSAKQRLSAASKERYREIDRISTSFYKRRKGNRFRARLIAVSSFIGFRTAPRVTLHDGTSLGNFRISLNVFRFFLYGEHQRYGELYILFFYSFVSYEYKKP